MTTSQITIVNKIAEVMDIHAHRFITTGNFGEAFSGSSLSILILLFASSGEEYSDFIIVVKLSWTLCKGLSINYVVSKSAIFDPLPLVVFFIK